MLHHTQYVHAGAKSNIVRDETKPGQDQRNNYLQSFRWIMPDHAACLQIFSSPPQLPAAQVVPVAQPDFSTKLLVAGFPPFKVITPSWQLYLCQATQCCQLSAHWCFHGLKLIQVGQHDLQTGTKAKQKPVLCAKGTTKHNPGIRKRWVLLNFTSKKVTSGVEMFKNCTRLLRKARSEVKMLKTPQVWSTLGSGTF